MNRSLEKAISCLTGALIHVALQLPFYFMAAVTSKLLMDADVTSIQWSTYYHCMIQISLGLLIFIRLCIIDMSIKKLGDQKDECPEEKNSFG